MAFIRELCLQGLSSRLHLLAAHLLLTSGHTTVCEHITQCPNFYTTEF